MSNYPDGLRPEDYCYMEGCDFDLDGQCKRCGYVVEYENYMEPLQDSGDQ